MSSDVNDDVASLLTSHTIGFVVRSLRRLGAPPNAAEDLAQDVLVTALTSTRFDPGQPLEPWLWGIAKAKLRDFRDLAWNRRVVLSSRAMLVTAAINTLATSSATNPDQLLAAALCRALQALDDDQQMLVVLHDLEAWSVPQCAQALQISNDAAKYRLATARQALKKQLMLMEGVDGG